jgi:hypothetical protein
MLCYIYLRYILAFSTQRECLTWEKKMKLSILQLCIGSQTFVTS